MRAAAKAGAEFIATPEATTYLGPHDKKIQLAEPLDGPTHQRLARLAKDLSITLLVGSVAERLDDTKAYNTSLLFGPDGNLIAHYRKMHLFDVEVPGGVSFRESDTCAPGDEVVVAETPLGNIGMSICYDLRFPALWRRLAWEEDCDLVVHPSAFVRDATFPMYHTFVTTRAWRTASTCCQ